LGLHECLRNEGGISGPERRKLSIKEDLAAELSRERYALSSLLEFARTLTPDLGPHGIIRSVLRTAMGKSLIKEAFAYIEISNQTGEEFELAARAGFADEVLPDKLDRRGYEKLINETGHRYTAVPLVSSDGSGYLGMLGLGPSINPLLSLDTEATYLASLAALTSIALTNAWLFEREKERERLESELRLARDIQQSLLPQRFPRMKGIEFAAFSKPSEWVGGDYYDVIELDNHRVLLAIADVVGKGVTAALTMSNLQAALRALVSLLRVGHYSLVDVVSELNRLMCESTSPERFITAVFGILDSTTGRLDSVVCGHPNPMISRPGKKVITVESSGIPLGIVNGFKYQLCTDHLDRGSLLVFYTDGLSEAMYSGKSLGEQGTAELVAAVANGDGSLDESLHHAMQDSAISIEDDVTVLAVQLN